jgi:hypothetical protein
MHRFLRRHTTDEDESETETVEDVRAAAERVAELAIEAEQAPDVTRPDERPAARREERVEQPAALRDGG